MNTENRVTGQPCKKCGTTEHIALVAEWPGGHYAKVICSGCQSFVKWAAKPDASKPRRGSAQKKLVARHSQGFCELCFRLGDSLPGPQTLEAHHVVPVEQGGQDDRGNIWIVCTPCHRMIHHQRTYLGHAFEQYQHGQNNLSEEDTAA